MITATVLAMNHRIGHQPELAPSQKLSGAGARQPPRNTVVISMETVTVWMYSDIMKNANLIDEYSVRYPPTRSPSDSGMSNGGRCASPTIATM